MAQLNKICGENPTLFRSPFDLNNFYFSLILFYSIFFAIFFPLECATFVVGDFPPCQQWPGRRSVSLPARAKGPQREGVRSPVNIFIKLKFRSSILGLSLFLGNTSMPRFLGASVGWNRSQGWGCVWEGKPPLTKFHPPCLFHARIEVHPRVPPKKTGPNKSPPPL